MKNKQLFLLMIALCLSANTLIAQKVTIKWSEEFVEEKGEKLGQILYDDGSFIYVRVTNISKGERGKGTSITPGIMKLDKELKPVARENYTSDKDDISLVDMFYMGGDFVMLTSKYEKASNTTEVFAVSIEKSTLKPKGKSVSLWKLSAPPKINFNWNASLSDDSSSMILFATYDQKDSEKERFAYKVVGKDLSTFQEKQVELKYINEDFAILGYKVSKSGDLYILSKGYKDGAKGQVERGADKKKVATYDIVILKYGKDASEKEYRIPMGDKVMDTYAMANDPATDDLFVVGTFQAATEDGVIGYFFNRINSKTGDVTSAKINQFPLSFIDKVNRLNDDKSKGKSPGISKYFNITDLIVTPDDRLYALVEKRYSATTTSKYGSYTTYYSNSIIAIQMDKNGTQAWMNHIPKSQFFNSLTAYIYYSTMVTKDKLYLFYNDIEKNLSYNINSAEEEP
ncbi:MAG: hypothetical protein ACKOYC_10020, partial [Bacteroidota bacterium]